MVDASYIPPAISPDQYDKLMRKIWELEQKVAAQGKVVLDSVSLDIVLDHQGKIEERLDGLTSVMEGVMALLKKQAALEAKAASAD